MSLENELKREIDAIFQRFCLSPEEMRQAFELTRGLRVAIGREQIPGLPSHHTEKTECTPLPTLTVFHPYAPPTDERYK